MKKEIGKIPVFRMAFKIYIGWALAKRLVEGLSNALDMYSKIIRKEMLRWYRFWQYGS